MKNRAKLSCKFSDFFSLHILQKEENSFLSILLLIRNRDKSRNTGRIWCRVCSEEYQTEINFLSEPIDVYNDWVDACETAN